jgi:cytochrome P450
VNSIPQAPGKLPVLGHALPLLRDPLAFLSSLPACGDLVRIKLGPVAAVVVCDPELTRQVLLDDRTFNLGGPLFDRVQEAVGNSMTKSTDQHLHRRRLVQPAFSQARLPGYARQMTTHLEELTGSWRDGQTLDILAEMHDLTTKSALAAMFSQALSPHALQQASEDLATIFAGFYRRAVTPPWLSRLPVPGNTRYHRAIARLRGTVSAIVAERRDGGADHGDLLSALLAAQDTPVTTPADTPVDTGAGSESQGLTDGEISDVVMAFFIAGVQTTANLLAWALHLVATHPDMQARLTTEVDAILAGAPASFEHMSGLRLTARVITETLRLYPPGWLLTRTVSTSTRLGEYPIAAGTALFYSPYIIHHRGDLYPEPERFDPDRWERVPPPPRHAFIAFGHGPRKCIGDTFGLTEATLALAGIVSRWHLEPVPDERVRPAIAFALRPRRLHLRATARTHRQEQVLADHAMGEGDRHDS